MKMGTRLKVVWFSRYGVSKKNELWNDRVLLFATFDICDSTICFFF